MLKNPFQNGKSKVTTRDLVMTCAFPGEPGESRKSALQRAAANAGLSYERMVAFFYGKGNPPDEAREKLLRAAAERQQMIQRWKDIEARNEIARLETVQARLERHVDAQNCAVAERQIAGEDSALPGIR